MSLNLSFDPTKLSSEHGRRTWVSVHKIFQLINLGKREKEICETIKTELHLEMCILKGYLDNLGTGIGTGTWTGTGTVTEIDMVSEGTNNSLDFEKFYTKFLDIVAQIPIDCEDETFLN